MTGQQRDFVFTIFHSQYPDWDPETCVKRNLINFFAGQEEVCPKTGQRHWQCVAQTAKRMGFRKFEEAIGIIRPTGKKTAFHCQRMFKNSSFEKNEAYCLKEETRAPNGKSIKFGEIFTAKTIWDYVRSDIKKGKRLNEVKETYPELCIRYATGLAAFYAAIKPSHKRAAPEKWHEWQQSVINLTDKPCDENDRTIHWFWEPIGNKGKSRLAKWLHDHRGAFLCNNGKTTDIAYAWDDNPIAVFDFARVTEEKINWGVMENISNGYLFSPKYQSGGKSFARPHIICFANFPPDTSKMSIDRWNIVKIDETTNAASAAKPPPPRAPIEHDEISNEDIEILLQDFCQERKKDSPSSNKTSNEVIHTPTGSGNNEPDPIPSKRDRVRKKKIKKSKNLRIRRKIDSIKKIPSQVRDHRVDCPDALETTARATHGPC